MILVNISIIIAFFLIAFLLISKIKKQKNEIYYIQNKSKRNLKSAKENYEKGIKQVKDEADSEIEAAKSLFLKERTRANQLQKKIDDVKCLICNQPSSGKHFCFSCYSKFKCHSFDIRIKNCKETDIIDFWGNKTEPCEDGRYVRSRAEQCIANYFYNNKIRYAYEKPLSYNGKILKPDFYLPDYDLYIEYNELKDEEYLRKKDFAMNIYKQLNKRVVVMTKEDREHMYEYFCKLLSNNS